MVISDVSVWPTDHGVSVEEGQVRSPRLQTLLETEGRLNVVEETVFFKTIRTRNS